MASYRDKDINRSIAERVAAGDFVPFIGAGCSKALLGGNDWPGITKATADALGIPASDDYTRIAQQYEQTHRRDGLVRFLAERLRLQQWNDAAGYPHIALMEIRFPFYYTTNVDNTVELCYQNYNRPLDVIVVPGDMKKQRAGAVTLYKFHGDTDHPDELVWTASDYERRYRDGEYFMHVLLRAHLLAKSLLYIGYSLQDPHVVDLLSDMRKRYPDAMRESVLIEYGRAPELRARAEALGIRMICTADLYPDRSEGEAFEAFLSDLGTEVKGIDAGRELEMLFARDGPGRPVLSDYDLRALEAKWRALPLPEAIKAFRATCSRKNIPKGFEDRILAIYRELCLKASTAAEATELAGALFTIEAQLSNSFYALAYCAAFTLYRFPNIHIIIKHLTETPQLKVMLTALAAEMMKDNGIPRNGEFADWIARASDYGQEVLDTFQEPVRSQVQAGYAEIFSGSPRTNPLTHSAPPQLPGRQTFQSLAESLMRNMPQRPPAHGR